VSKIIFLIGKAGSGKDTVAKLFADDGYKRLAFADALKKDYYSEFCVNYCSDTEDRDFKEKHRQGLINYGEHMRNTQGKSYWIKEAFKNYDGEDLIITDVRRDSEVNFIKLLKLSLSRVFFYYIDRHVEDNDGLTLLSIKESRSLIDGIIDNNGNLKQLKENVKQVSRQIERRARRKSENRAGSKATVLDVLREL
jgi:dephospho-CoA kinase|tara:strand:- start:10758 stop:11342 length:585 start_codon:yes stop_codon:yes gene_type:complete